MAPEFTRFRDGEGLGPYSLPEGTWTLTAIAGTDAAWSAPSWHATVEARTGRDDVRIELVPIGE